MSDEMDRPIQAIDDIDDGRRLIEQAERTSAWPWPLLAAAVKIGRDHAIGFAKRPCEGVPLAAGASGAMERNDGWFRAALGVQMRSRTEACRSHGLLRVGASAPR